MMRKMFCLYDTKAEIYHEPFYCRTVGEAERAVQMQVNDSSHHLSKFAEDYTLFEVGVFDTDKGILEPLPTLHSISKLHHYKKEEPKKKK